MGKVSVVINTFNEEKNLPRALASVKNFADEIVVVDMKSDDNTVSIAKKAKAKVYEFKKVGYVEPARNYAIEKTTGDWILILDADEELPGSLKKNLKEIINKPKGDYYRIPRINIIFGKWIKHSRWWPDYNIRLFKKGHVSWSEVIHSVPETTGKGMDLGANKDNAIVHYTYQTLEQYIDRMNRYTTLHASILAKENYKFDWRDLIKKPSNEFLSRYFRGEGYKDGVHGLALALLQAFSELVLYLKVWQKEKFANQTFKVREAIEMIKESESDLNYWQADTLIKEGAGIKQRIKRKLKLR